MCVCVCVVFNEQYVNWFPVNYVFPSILATVDGPGVIPAGSTRTWDNVPLQVPPTVSSQLAGCNIINVYYMLHVRHSLSRTFLVHRIIKGPITDFLSSSYYKRSNHGLS